MRGRDLRRLQAARRRLGHRLDGRGLVGLERAQRDALGKSLGGREQHLRAALVGNGYRCGHGLGKVNAKRGDESNGIAICEPCGSHRKDTAALSSRWRQGSVFLLDAGDIIDGLEPFFAEAARRTEKPRDLDVAKDGSSDADIVSGPIGADLARDSNDIGGFALWAPLGISHETRPRRGVQPEQEAVSVN
jgi:hypothetical protein